MARVVLYLFILLYPASLFAFWPVYWEFDGKKNVLGPLFSYEEENGNTHITARPILSSYDSPGTFNIIYPLGKRTEDHAYFAPFYSRHTTSDDKQDVSLFNVFWGRDGEKSYGGAFPFYGRLYNRYGKDEIGFVLWPLYAHIIKNEATRTDVAWPIFSSYGGHEEGFKIWPLFGERKYGDERKTMFALWPFFIRDERGLATDAPLRSTWFIPFYMQSESPNSKFYGVLWPFFTYTRVRNRYEINAPWPLFSYSKGEEEKKKSFSVWPIYSRNQNDKDQVTHILWPLFKEVEHHLGDTVWTEKRFFLLNKYAIDDRGTFLNVWPLFEYRASADDKKFYFPSLMPWREKNFDRIMRPLITLFELRKTNDSVATNFLYGFYTKEQKGESWKRRLAFLFEVKKEPEGMGFQILSGLFGIDRKTIKMFFIPLSRGTPMPDLCPE
jgi:hypothetical protein